MQADRISKIFRSFADVLLYQFIDISASRAEQSDNISCSVVSQTGIDRGSGILTGALVAVCFHPAGKGFRIRGVL